MHDLFTSLAAALVLAGCGAPPARTVTVFAAASLTAPFEALAAAFEAVRPGVDVRLSFAGTPQLVLQLREGAAADVFASADEIHMARVVESGRTAAPPRVFATNRLAIAVALGNPRGVQGLADLARADLVVALCGPEVPAGRYARAALERAGVAARSVSDEPSVSALISKVRLGEVDAGIVYVTDVATARASVSAVEIQSDANVVARYPIAPLRAGQGGSPIPAEPGAAEPGGRGSDEQGVDHGADGDTEAFVAFVLSAEGQAILRSFEFGAP
ncbi:MAG: molybdate ABC transporter substrate-binding protein [Planctomycetota bacterium]